MTDDPITLRFADEETENFVKLVCRRKSVNLADYIVDNFEWDDQPYCFGDEVSKITSDVCDGCQWIDSCPDVVKQSETKRRKK